MNKTWRQSTIHKHGILYKLWTSYHHGYYIYFPAELINNIPYMKSGVNIIIMVW